MSGVSFKAEVLGVWEDPYKDVDFRSKKSIYQKFIDISGCGVGVMFTEDARYFIQNSILAFIHYLIISRVLKCNMPTVRVSLNETNRSYSLYIDGRYHDWWICDQLNYDPNASNAENFINGL